MQHLSQMEITFGRLSESFCQLPIHIRVFRKGTHFAHVGLQLSDTLILRCVQDHREFGKVLLGLHWILHL